MAKGVILVCLYIVVTALGILLAVRYFNVLEANRIIVHTTGLTIVAIGFSTYFSLRSNYLYNSRQADMQILAFTAQAKSVGLPNADSAKQMAQDWLKFSEDYRHASRSRGYSALLMIYSGILLLLSMFLAVAVNVPLWVGSYFLSAMVFVSALFIHFGNFGYETKSSVLDRLPPLHLLRVPPRWKNVQSAIDTNDWLKAYYDNLISNPASLGI